MCMYVCVPVCVYVYVCIDTHIYNLKWNNAKGKYIDEEVEISQMEGNTMLNLDVYRSLFQLSQSKLIHSVICHLQPAHAQPFSLIIQSPQHCIVASCKGTTISI